MLRAAIVGLGSWGQTLVGLVQGRSEDMRFTRAYTPNASKAQAFCSVVAARNFRFAAYGTRGFAEVLTPNMDTFRFLPATAGRASHLAPLPATEVIETPGFQSVAEALAQFARCALERRPFPVASDDILHGVAVLEAAVLSAATEQPVTLERD